MKTTLTCIIVGALAATAIPAQAEVNTEGMHQITVRHDDLNLLSKRGMKALERRVHNAALEVCGVNDIRTGTRIRSQHSLECYDKAMNSAKREIAIAKDNQASRAVRVARNGN